MTTPIKPVKQPKTAKGPKSSKAKRATLTNRPGERSIIASRSRIVKHHPLLSELPPVDAYSPEVLRLAENIRLHGIMDPLKVIPAQTPGDFILVDGRNRQAASGLIPLKELPLIVVTEEEALSIILNALFHRKHFTKGARAYLALPLLLKVVEATRARQNANLKQGEATPEEGSMPSMLLAASLEVECAKLGFSTDLYQQAVKLREIFAGDHEYKERVEPEILCGEMGLGAAIAGHAGRTATNKKPKAKGIRYLTLGGNGKISGLLPKACTSLCNGFKDWAGLELEARAAFKREWDSLMDMLPADLR